jgi:surface polysaccharide O-acyltransferase-like enzyme
MERVLFFLSVALFIIGLAGGAYADTPIGFHSAFNFRNGPFFSLIMFSTGYALQRRGRELPSIWIGLAIAIAGFTIQMCEVIWLQQRWGANMSHDYVVGTFFFGLGVTLVALSNVKPLRIPALASIGPLVLGIYACHFLYVDLLRRLTTCDMASLFGTSGMSYSCLCCH